MEDGFGGNWSWHSVLSSSILSTKWRKWFIGVRFHNKEELVLAVDSFLKKLGSFCYKGISVELLKVHQTILRFIASEKKPIYMHT